MARYQPIIIIIIINGWFRGLLGLFYRSPTSDAVNNGLLLEALDKTMGNKNAQRVRIMGDFN